MPKPRRTTRVISREFHERSTFLSGESKASILSLLTAPARHYDVASLHRASKSKTLVDDVVPAIHVKRLSGDQLRRIMGEERGSHTHILDADETRSGRLGVVLVEQLVELRERSTSECPIFGR